MQGAAELPGPSLQCLWGFSGPGGWRWSRTDPLGGSWGPPLLSGPRGAQGLQDFHPRARPQQACLPPALPADGTRGPATHLCRCGQRV